MHPARVLVTGGYGFFGRRLVQALARQSGLHVIVAGRSAQRGRALVRELEQGLGQTARGSASATLDSVALDVHASGFAAELAALAPHVVVHTCGPFQGQDYHVAMACMAAGAHAIDLADGREFVAGITGLHPQAVAAGLAVISGASSVPALSCAAADHLAQGLRRIDAIDIGISPGNRTERGRSTIQAVLSYCGQPLPVTGPERTFGWSGSRRHEYPAPVGRRLLSPCDVPDLVLLPSRYAGNPVVSFGAGLELSLLHRGMNAMAMLTRWGIVPDWSAHAGLLARLADGFRHLGSDAGAMHVRVTGIGAEGDISDISDQAAPGARITRTWQLVATQGDGPHVPTLAAAALVRGLCSGDAEATAALVGARPCIGMLTLADFAREAQGLHIQMGEVSA